MTVSGEDQPKGQVSGEIPVSEWARRCGISVQAANKRIRTLGIARGPRGGVDPAVADRVVAERIDARQQRPKAAGPVGQPATDRAVETREPQPEAHATGDSLNDARLETERERARKFRLENDEAEGRMLDRTEVARTLTDLITPAVTKLRGLGARLGPFVAVENDAAVCQRIIDGAVFEAMTEISEYRPDA